MDKTGSTFRFYDKNVGYGTVIQNQDSIRIRKNLFRIRTAQKIRIRIHTHCIHANSTTGFGKWYLWIHALLNGRRERCRRFQAKETARKAAAAAAAQATLRAAEEVD
jgi:hypothetical protein